MIPHGISIKNVATLAMVGPRTWDNSLALRLQMHTEDDVPFGVYTDVACTTPATTEYQAVAAWRDELSGWGIIGSQSDVDKRPLLRFDGGVPYLEFDGVDDVLVTNLSINAAGLGTRGLLAMGHRYPGSRIAYDTILCARPGVVAIQCPAVANTYAYNWTDDAAQYNWSGGPAVNADWRSYVLRVEPTSAIVTLDGSSTTNTQTQSGASGSAVFQIGADPGGGRYSAVDVSSVIIAPTPDFWSDIATQITTLLPA